MAALSPQAPTRSIEPIRAWSRSSRTSELGVWRNYSEPKFGDRPVAAITPAEVSAWVGQLISDGRASATAARALATLRSVLAFAVADSRRNVS